MEWHTTLTVLVIMVLGLMAIGVPIAFAMGIAGFLGLVLLATPNVALTVLTGYLITIPQNFTLVAIPLFIFMAEIIIFSGLGGDLYNALSKFLSGYPGGLATATIGFGTVFAAVSGSSIAGCATIGPIAINEMVKRGYSKSFSSGCVAAAGGLALIIPPSIPMIIYGYIASVSVAKLFIGGIIPGLLIATGYLILIWVISAWGHGKVPLGARLGWKERLLALLKVGPFLVLVFLVLGTIYLGVTTPTEAAGVGVFGALALSIVYRRLTWQKFINGVIIEAAKTAGFIMLLVVCALMFGFTLIYLGLPSLFAEFTTAFQASPYLILLMTNLLVLILGCVIDANILILVIVPVILPGLIALGFDPIALGVILVLNVEIGCLTPPVGLNLFVILGLGEEVGGITFGEVARGVIPFALLDIVVLALLITFPTVILWLVGYMG